jgi:predicted nucleic acid-binding protein
MKVIVDTNILISAIIRDNVPEQVILWLVSQPLIEPMGLDWPSISKQGA